MDIKAPLAPAQASQQFETDLAAAHAALFPANSGIAHGQPQAAARPFQIFSLHDAATPVLYTNHTR